MIFCGSFYFENRMCMGTREGRKEQERRELESNLLFEEKWLEKLT